MPRGDAERRCLPSRVAAQSIGDGLRLTLAQRVPFLMLRGPSRPRSPKRKAASRRDPHATDSLLSFFEGYACSYTRIFEMQARLLARVAVNELDTYPPFEVR